MEGIRLDGDKIVIHGQTLNREQFKAALDAIRDDPKSAFSNAATRTISRPSRS